MHTHTGTHTHTHTHTHLNEAAGLALQGTGAQEEQQRAAVCRGEQVGQSRLPVSCVREAYLREGRGHVYAGELCQPCTK